MEPETINSSPYNDDEGDDHDDDEDADEYDDDGDDETSSEDDRDTWSKVQDLAYQIEKDEVSRNLVLHVEQALVDLLENKNSPDEVLELEPMSPYERFLIHSLADIFRVTHESVGEGFDRHLILKRGPKSAIPDHRLVSGYLFKLRKCHVPLSAPNFLKRKEPIPATTLDLICRYNGVMETQPNGRAEYIGGETKMRNCSTSTPYKDFVKILEDVSQTDPSRMEISFRYYASGFACKIDGESDYTSMIDKHKRNPSQDVIIWIFKEEREPVRNAGNNQQLNARAADGVAIGKTNKEVMVELCL